MKTINSVVVKKGVWNYDLEKSSDYENGFYLTSKTTRLAKSIAHW